MAGVRHEITPHTLQAAHFREVLQNRHRAGDLPVTAPHGSHAQENFTRARRVETTVEWLAEGKSRNWKYVKG